jgi:hypothetical protein
MAAATVSGIARAADLQFDRADTELALRARLIDLATVREDLARKFLLRADESLEAMDSPTILGGFGGRDNTWNETLLDAPTYEQRQTLLRTAHMAAQKAVDLLKVDAEQGSASARGMVIELRDMLSAAIDGAEAAGDLPDPTVTPEGK